MLLSRPELLELLLFRFRHQGTNMLLLPQSINAKIHYCDHTLLKTLHFTSWSVRRRLQQFHPHNGSANIIPRPDSIVH
jgi:hypothetical protein